MKSVFLGQHCLVDLQENERSWLGLRGELVILWMPFVYGGFVVSGNRM